MEYRKLAKVSNGERLQELDEFWESRMDSHKQHYRSLPLGGTRNVFVSIH